MDKSGANVLFEDPRSKGNNIGVVVNPVRIASLKDFGSLDDVANKLLQAERKKVLTSICYRLAYLFYFVSLSLRLKSFQRSLSTCSLAPMMLN